MTFKDVANRISDKAADVIAHPMAFVCFNALWITGISLGRLDETNLFISVLTADILFITSIAQRRRDNKLEQEVDALAEVQPEIDDKSIKDNC